MFESVTYLPLLGKPLIAYLGILTLLLVLLTVSIPLMNKRGFHAIPFRWHPWFAAAAVCLALIHGAMGILAYF